MKTLTLEAYTARVNALAQAHCDRLNRRKPAPLFAARHHPFDTGFLAWYHAQGYRPAQALASINREAAQEQAAEARMS